MKSTPSGLLALALSSLVVCAVVTTTFSEEAAQDEWKAPARASRKKNPIPADEKSIARGEEVFVRECVSCHGKTGKGDGTAAADLHPKPRDLRDPRIWDQTDGSIFWKLTEGRKPMPSFEKTLSEDDRWHVINYIHKFAPSGTGSTTQP
jgi:mono/diheme cytochrome c family protein